MAGIFVKLKSRVQRITGRMDRYQEAITFAEAGQINRIRWFMKMNTTRARESCWWSAVKASSTRK